MWVRRYPLIIIFNLSLLFCRAQVVSYQVEIYNPNSEINVGHNSFVAQMMYPILDSLLPTYASIENPVILRYDQRFKLGATKQTFVGYKSDEWGNEHWEDEDDWTIDGSDDRLSTTDQQDTSLYEYQEDLYWLEDSEYVVKAYRSVKSKKVEWIGLFDTLNTGKYFIQFKDLQKLYKSDWAKQSPEDKTWYYKENHLINGTFADAFQHQLIRPDSIVTPQKEPILIHKAKFNKNRIGFRYETFLQTTDTRIISKLLLSIQSGEIQPVYDRYNQSVLHADSLAYYQCCNLTNYVLDPNYLEVVVHFVFTLSNDHKVSTVSDYYISLCQSAWDPRNQKGVQIQLCSIKPTDIKRNIGLNLPTKLKSTKAIQTVLKQYNDFIYLSCLPNEDYIVDYYFEQTNKDHLIYNSEYLQLNQSDRSTFFNTLKESKYHNLSVFESYFK